VSNIAVIYGYGFDMEDVEDPNGFRTSLDDLESDHLELPNGLQIVTGYSVGSYAPTAFAIGVPVMEDVAMFWPTELENRLTAEQKKLVDDWRIPYWLKEALLETNTRRPGPKFLVYGFTDD
jgi:hypothetical protein